MIALNNYENHKEMESIDVNTIFQNRIIIRKRSYGTA